MIPDDPNDELEVLLQGGLEDTGLFVDKELRKLLEETKDFIDRFVVIFLFIRVYIYIYIYRTFTY